MSAVFIALEGGEGCGKSTQARLLAAAIDAVATFEPGDTPAGRRLRDLLLSPDTGALDARTEALLMAADRAQHVAEVVRPALAAGRHVVTDRYVGSSMAYQGAGRGLPVAEVRALSAWATGGLWPDLTVLLDVPTALAAARLGVERDRFESEGDHFHERVAEGFRSLAATAPEPWVVIDGARPVDEVAASVRVVVRERLQLTM